MVKEWCKIFATVAALCASSVFASAEAVPKPKLKPDKIKTENAPTLIFTSGLPTSGWSADELKAARHECLQRLDGLKVHYKALAPLGKSEGCGAPAPLEVDRISGVAIVPPGIFTCDMVEALHGWISSSVMPAARQHLNKQLVTINNASAYVCRRRNGLASGKLSEHAKANALDIATLAFEDGSTINIKGDWSGLKQLVGVSGKGNFLRQIRRDSCIRFTTVLGPGSDKYHGDHFHVDVARRKNGYRICK
jgi:hypothetical protein